MTIALRTVMASRQEFAVALTLIVLSVASVVGCATPAPLVSLRPHRDDVIWVAGRASIQKQEAGVRVAAAFEHQDGDTLAIRVEVENRTDHRLELGPADIGFTSCAAADNPTASCSIYQVVIDPERALTDLQRKQSIELATATNDAALGTPLLLLGVVGDVGAVASGRGDLTTGWQSAAVANQIENDLNRHDTALSAIAVQRQTWSNVALRRNTLFPGTGVGGLVYVPIDIRARYIWLAVQIPGGRRVPFCFEQVVTPVAPDAPSQGQKPLPGAGAKHRPH